MKTRILIALLTLVAGVIACLAGPTTNAPSVKLAWDQSPDPSAVGYRVYWGTAAGAYTNSVSVSGITNTTATITSLARGATYHFAATCYTATGLESGYSTEALYTTVPIPNPPTSLTVTVENP